MAKKITLADLEKIANNNRKTLKPMEIKISECAKKYDRIRLSQEHTKKVLQMQ